MRSEAGVRLAHEALYRARFGQTRGRSRANAAASNPEHTALTLG